jgi:hypothetical protein
MVFFNKYNILEMNYFSMIGIPPFGGFGFYTYDGLTGCRETSTAYYWDLLENDKY